MHKNLSNTPNLCICSVLEGLRRRKNLVKHVNTIDQMKKSKDERLQELTQLKNQVDKMIDEEKNKL